MKALRSFTVQPRTTDALAPLHDRPLNLRWTWEEGTQAVIRAVEPLAWEATHTESGPIVTGGS